jgi:hypothetical protein
MTVNTALPSGIVQPTPMARNERGILVPMMPQGVYSLNHPDTLTLLRYQLGIYERMKARGLLEIDWMNQPGEIAKRYREMRKEDPEMQEIYRWARQIVGTKAAVPIPREVYNAYPIMISKLFIGQNVTDDYLISREMTQVALFWLKNELEDPYKDPKRMRPDEVAMLYDQRLKKFRMHNSTGQGMVYLGPGDGIPILLLGDAHAPRHMPDCVLELFDPYNWQHNPYLRTDRGVLNADQFVFAPEAGSSDDGRRTSTGMPPVVPDDMDGLEVGDSGESVPTSTGRRRR